LVRKLQTEFSRSGRALPGPAPVAASPVDHWPAISAPTQQLQSVKPPAGRMKKTLTGESIKRRARRD
jgi:hypothetical protein